MTRTEESLFHFEAGFFVLGLTSGAVPAIRCNLLCRTPPQKDFHYYRG